MTESEIRWDGGVPRLYADGAEVIGNAYITYFTHKACYADFAEDGCRLFSVPVFFASRTINDLSQIPPFGEGIFENREAPDYTAADREFLKILDACPDALIFPRVNLSLPLWWEREHPEELCDTGFTENRRPCFSSDRWAEDTKNFLGQFIRHVRESSYASHIIGYQLAGGNTEEWFSFDQQGSVGIRSREKFAEVCAREHLAGTEAEYYAFLSRMTADRICEFASFAKEQVGHRQVIGAFYGYTFECTARTSCHHALSRVLECPDIDFLCSPASYMDDRICGQDDPCMLPVDSLKLHGKLYFVENDTRTHLTTPPNDLPHYNTRVWMPRDKAKTLELLKLHYSRALTHGHALWWFDMWGGWYRDEAYRTLFRRFWEISGDAVGENLTSAAETALFIDEAAFAYLSDTPKDREAGAFVYRFRIPMGKIGAPYDCYLLSDYREVCSRYRAHIVLKPHDSPLFDDLFSAGTAENVMVVTPEDRDVTPAVLRDFVRRCGVFLYTACDAVVFANERYLFLHTCGAGQYDLHLPEGVGKKPLLGDFRDGVLPGGQSYLFALTKQKGN